MLDTALLHKNAKLPKLFSEMHNFAKQVCERLIFLQSAQNFLGERRYFQIPKVRSESTLFFCCQVRHRDSLQNVEMLHFCNVYSSGIASFPDHKIIVIWFRHSHYELNLHSRKPATWTVRDFRGASARTVVSEDSWVIIFLRPSLLRG